MTKLSRSRYAHFHFISRSPDICRTLLERNLETVIKVMLNEWLRISEFRQLDKFLFAKSRATMRSDLVSGKATSRNAKRSGFRNAKRSGFRKSHFQDTQSHRSEFWSIRPYELGKTRPGVVHRGPPLLPGLMVEVLGPMTRVHALQAGREEWLPRCDSPSLMRSRSDEQLAPAPASIMKTRSDGNLTRERIKASVIAQLLPLLQPRLLQDGLPPDEAVQLLVAIHIDVLQRALATGNLQPVLAKLTAGAYQRQEMKKLGSSDNLQQRMLLAQLQPALLPALEQRGLSWGDALPELKRMAQADLSRCIVSGCVAPILEQLASSRSAAPTRSPSAAPALARSPSRSANRVTFADEDEKASCGDIRHDSGPSRAAECACDTPIPSSQMPSDVLPKQMTEADLDTRPEESFMAPPIVEQLHFLRDKDGPFLAMSQSAAPTPAASAAFVPASDQDDRDEKASVVARLLPLLQPRLLQDGLCPDVAAPLLAKVHIDVLQRALATGNLQPVLAKLKAAAYQRPAIKKLGSSDNLLQCMLLAQLQPVLLPALEQRGISWRDAVPELKKMAQADLYRCLVSGCVVPILEQLAAPTPAAPVPSFTDLDDTASTISVSDLDICLLQYSANVRLILANDFVSGSNGPIVDQPSDELAMRQSASPTPAACEASLVYSKSSPPKEEPTFDLEEDGRQPEGAKRRKSKLDATAPFPSPVASRRGSEAGVPILLLLVLLFCLLGLELGPVLAQFFYLLPRTPIDHPPNRDFHKLSLNPRERMHAPVPALSARGDQGVGAGVYSNNERKGTGATEVWNDSGHAQCVECVHGLCVECEESEVWKFGGGAGAAWAGAWATPCLRRAEARLRLFGWYASGAECQDTTHLSNVTSKVAE